MGSEMCIRDRVYTAEMERLLTLFGASIAGSATLVGRAGDAHQRDEGRAESPGECSGRAALLLARLHAMDGQPRGEELSRAEVEELLDLARSVLGGVWGALPAWRRALCSPAEEWPEHWTRRGAAWAWGALGRALGVPPAPTSGDN